MARQVLDHGVIIPAEYSDDWFEDMSTNLNKLDDVIGSDEDKLSEADVSNVALSGDYDDLTNKPDLKAVATSGDYDDLTNKPSYGVLRMTSETLSNSGSGAISNLNSDSKLAAGDYVLDAALKVFLITAVSAPNYTVGTALFQVTNASALAAVATSGSYDDLNNLPTYGITRFVNAGITDNSNVAFANISSVDKIKAGDFLLDNAGKMYLIASVDLVNETAAVTTPLTRLALDGNVVHTSGDEDITGVKSFINYLLGKNLSGQTVDLNDCVDAYGGAIHYYYAVSNYTNISNKPENKPFILISKTVRYVSSIDYIYHQKLYTADYNAPPSIYTRYYRSGSSSWSNWVKDTDKFVTTDTVQTVSEQKTFSSNVYVYNSDSATDVAHLVFKNQKAERGGSLSDSQVIYFTDSLVRSLATIRCQVGSSGQSLLVFRSDNVDSNNNNVYSGLSIISYKNGIKAVSPYSDGDISLGTTNSKWLTVYTSKINNVAPSVLSLPSQTYVDISGYFTNTGTGEFNTYTAPSNGWIFLRLGDISSCQAQVLDSSDNLLWGTSSSGSVEMITIPILSGCKLQTQWVTGSTVNVAIARFYPCQGNI